MSGDRKDDHVRLAAAQGRGQQQRSELDDIEFLHHALAGLDRSHVRLDASVGPWQWPVPIYLNGMTGGSPRTGRINRELAIAARETGLPIATGSMSVALAQPEALPSFLVIRQELPEGFVMANLGADRTADDARRVVDALAANALQVHVNTVQEIVMPEGGRDFAAWAGNLERIRAAVDVPVIVKEVGFGLSRRTLRLLHELGIELADVSGRGGTDFARIENERRELGDYAYLAGWGQSAAASLLDAAPPHPALLASGGVRTPLDVVRLLALGAQSVGIAGTFLRVVLDGGAPALVAELERWLAQLRDLLTVLGAAAPAELRHADVLVRGRLREYCRIRGIDSDALSRRSDGAVQESAAQEEGTASGS